MLESWLECIDKVNPASWVSGSVRKGTKEQVCSCSHQVFKRRGMSRREQGVENARVGYSVPYCLQRVTESLSVFLIWKPHLKRSYLKGLRVILFIEFNNVNSDSLPYTLSYLQLLLGVVWWGVWIQTCVFKFFYFDSIVSDLHVWNCLLSPPLTKHTRRLYSPELPLHELWLFLSSIS